MYRGGPSKSDKSVPHTAVIEIKGGIADGADASAEFVVAAMRAAFSPTGDCLPSRSVFGGYVEWPLPGREESGEAGPIAPADHWQLADVIAVVERVRAAEQVTP